MEHHDLDIDPIPKESRPLFINEPWLIDRFLQWIQETGYDPTPLSDDDNNGPATESNELDFSYDVNSLISQIEIYDQVWFVRHCPKHGRHSAEAVDLVKEFVNKLEDIQVHDAELFPYDTIVELKKEYLMTDCN